MQSHKNPFALPRAVGPALCAMLVCVAVMATAAEGRTTRWAKILAFTSPCIRDARCHQLSERELARRDCIPNDQSQASLDWKGACFATVALLRFNLTDTRGYQDALRASREACTGQCPMRDRVLEQVETRIKLSIRRLHSFRFSMGDLQEPKTTPHKLESVGDSKAPRLRTSDDIRDIQARNVYLTVVDNLSNPEEGSKKALRQLAKGPPPRERYRQCIDRYPASYHDTLCEPHKAWADLVEAELPPVTDLPPRP